MLLLQTAHVKSHNCNRWKHGQEVMKWNSASPEMELKWWSSEWNHPVTTKKWFYQSATHEADVNSDVWYPRCSCVIPLHGVKLWMHCITSQFSSYVQNWLTILERNIQNQQKMPPSYATKCNARAHSIHTVKSVLRHSLFSWPQSMWLQSDFKT
jgi:hypothetical protein